MDTQAIRDIKLDIERLIGDMRFRRGMASSIRVEPVDNWIQQMVLIQEKLDKVANESGEQGKDL